MTAVLRRYNRGRKLVSVTDAIAGTKSVYHFDHQGSTQCLTDATTGAVTARFSSDAWGVPLPAVAREPFSWQGDYGMMAGMSLAPSYSRARYYTPILGQWLSRDPLRELRATYPYQGFQNDPVGQIDPSGESPCPLAWKRCTERWKDVTHRTVYRMEPRKDEVATQIIRLPPSHNCPKGPSCELKCATNVVITHEISHRQTLVNGWAIVSRLCERQEFSSCSEENASISLSDILGGLTGMVPGLGSIIGGLVASMVVEPGGCKKSVAQRPMGSPLVNTLAGPHWQITTIRNIYTRTWHCPTSVPCSCSRCCVYCNNSSHYIAACHHPPPPGCRMGGKPPCHA